MKKTITYAQVGDNYDTKDPVKKMAQTGASQTSRNLRTHGFPEVSDTRGESAFVWRQGKIYMAAVIEGLGTKNLVADQMRKITGKTHYDMIAHDTVATIINDLVTVGAKPLVLHAYWAIEDNGWLADQERMGDLIRGWKEACDTARVTWGGGETPTMKGIVVPGTCELGGSAVGIISARKQLLLDKNLKAGDRILLIQSNGVNANGISLVRAIGKKLPQGYGTKLPNGESYGAAVLTRPNIYARLIQNLFAAGVEIHYIAHITGHGMRKIMRARPAYTYVLEKIFPPQPVFPFLQKHAHLSDYEMYQTYNMGQDYALFIPAKHIQKAQAIVRKNKFHSLDAGYVAKGPRQVIIQPKNLTYAGDTLDLR